MALNLPKPMYMLVTLLAVSLSATALWVLAKDDSTVDNTTSRVEVVDSKAPAALAESESPVAPIEKPEHQAEEPLTEPEIANHIGDPRFSDGDRQVFQDGPVRVEQIAENCRMPESGWTCDWRLETYNPYEELDESELRGLADFDPYAGLMLAEVVKDRGASESEIFDILIRSVALFPNEDKGRVWMHTMYTLGKSAFPSPDVSDAVLLENYAWLVAGINLGILSIKEASLIEQELVRRELKPEIGRDQATVIADDVRNVFLNSGNNQSEKVQMPRLLFVPDVVQELNEPPSKPCDRKLRPYKLPRARPVGTSAATACISTLRLGKARHDSTVARTGLLPSETHLFHTAFIAVKSFISARYTLTLSNADLSVPASASNMSIFRSTCRVWSSIEDDASSATWPAM